MSVTITRTDQLCLFAKHGFIRQDVKSGGRHLSAFQRLDQLLGIDHVAARRVDDYDTIFHSPEGVCRHKMTGPGCGRHVQGYYIGGRQEVVKTQIRKTLARRKIEIRRDVKCTNVHAKPVSNADNMPPDGAGANQAKRFSSKIEAGQSGR